MAESTGTVSLRCHYAGFSHDVNRLGVMDHGSLESGDTSWKEALIRANCYRGKQENARKRINSKAY